MSRGALLCLIGISHDFHFSLPLPSFSLGLVPLTIRLGGIVTTVDDQILRPIVEAARQIAVENRLDAVGVALLGIERGTRHVGYHGVAAAKGVLGVAQRVVLGRRLGEPDVTAIAAEVA